MIKFPCPGCQTVFNVTDDKAGKKGKCPKCQTPFTIPQPAAAASAPPAPPKLDPNAPVEIEPCPGCGAVLTVTPEFLGADVECPSCNTVFAAAKPGGPKPKPKPPAPAKAEDAFAGLGDDEDDAPPPKKKSKARYDDDEEDDAPPPKKKGALAKVEDDYDDDEEDEDRPRKKGKKGGKVESKRVVAGILGILLGGFGVHKFYLGYTVPGILQIVITFCTAGLGGFIGTIEGIMYLVADDKDFIRNQQAGKKAWF